MKKILAIVLSALLLMTVCASLSAVAEGGLVISVDKAEAAAGEDVEVKFVVDSNSGFWGISLDVAYDTSVLTLKGVQFDSAFTADVAFLPVTAGAETFTINGMANSLDTNCTTTGTLATATFTVAADAAEGTTADVKVTFKPSNQTDVDMNDVATTVNDGSVKVAAKAPVETTTTTEKTPDETTTTTAQGDDDNTTTTTAAVADDTDATTTTAAASPATGSALPIAAIVLAAGSAAVLTFARKK